MVMHGYFSVIPVPRWQDVLDILIVAYVIYRIGLLIRGTRAMQMVVGLVVVGVAFVGSQMLGLFTINWLLNSFLGSLIVIIVVLFQSDIRRGLTSVGSRSLLNFPQGASRIAAQELAKAVAWLSARKIGALIVLEREVGLSEYVESGHPIGGRLSAEILETIFMPRSPMHDGAVIIDGEQVLAAGCLLPLSTDPDASLGLGTRHRAALGITEDSDAVAIVVSEEDGTVSLAQRGRLMRGLKPVELVETLQMPSAQD
jgi:diadenylate cyclase